jgi:hypothetical protein
MDGRLRFEIDQARAARTSCPACGHAGLDLRLVCESGDTCTRTAVCESCAVTYHVRDDEFSPQVESLLPSVACRACGHVGAHVGILCDVPSHVCDPTVICDACGSPAVDSRVA